MKFNEIVKWKTSIGNFPCTRKFDSDNLPVDDSSKKHLRVWNSFKSTLSAAIICGLEVMPINKTTNILYIGTLNDDIKLNFLDLVENNQEIIVLNENNPKTNGDYNPTPTRNASIKYVNSLEQIQGKFLVIYIDDVDFTLEKIANLSNQFLNNSGYLIISLKKSSREKFEKIFSNLSQSFQIIQELNIESYFRNKSLFLFKNRNVK